MEIVSLKVGVEILGLDLNEPIDEPVLAELKRLLAERQLLVCREQQLSPEGQVRVLSMFGNVVDEGGDGTGHQYVSGDKTSTKPGRLLFHSDNHFLPAPLEFLSLYGEDVGEQATPTSFADNVEGYKRLPREVKDRIERLEVINRTFFHLGYSDQPARELPAALEGGPVSRHPAVWRHPETGAPFVYLTELHSFRLDGISPDDSNALLSGIFDTLYDPHMIYEHKWCNGDLVIWNNRTVQHARGSMPEGKASGATARSVRRVAVGPSSLRDQFRFAPEALAAVGAGDFYHKTVAQDL